MQANLDLFDNPVAGPAPAAPPSRAPSQEPESHPFGAPKTRARLREELTAANVATVRFDIDAALVTRVSQFIPAGNQCIGLYPEPLKRVGLEMLAELVSQGPWSGAIEWDVAADRPVCLNAQVADEPADQFERPGA
jgi:hypothetical protein